MNEPIYKIVGISDEFTPVEGVVDDTETVLLNLKTLRFKAVNSDYFDQPRMYRLHVKNSSGSEKIVTAADIKLNSKVKLLTSQAYLATLQPHSELDMEVQIELGRGYVAAEEFRRQHQPVVTVVEVITQPGARECLLKDLPYSLQFNLLGCTMMQTEIM